MPLIDTNDHVIPGLIHLPGPRQVVLLPKIVSAVIAKGDLLFNDSVTDEKWEVAGTAAAERGPYAVAVKAAANGDTTVAAVVAGAIISVTAGAAISPGAYVKPSAVTAGRVDEFVLATDNVGLKCAVYLKQENSVPMGDGVTLPTAAAVDDVIQIQLIE